MFFFMTFSAQIRLHDHVFNWIFNLFGKRLEFAIIITNICIYIYIYICVSFSTPRDRSDVAVRFGGKALAHDVALSAELLRVSLRLSPLGPRLVLGRFFMLLLI